MSDREKVMKGLQCLSSPYAQDMNGRDCENCQYDNASCFLDITADALALLKEQEPIQMQVLEDYGSIKFGYCPKCKSLINNRSYPKSCGCGQAVKWDE